MKIDRQLLEDTARKAISFVRSYLTNPYFWVGAGILAVPTGILYLIFNVVIMPSFTRYGESVVVPRVMNYSYDDAVALLDSTGLQSEQIILRKSNVPTDVVIDQNPPPDAQVKPGRRVYLTINVGDTTTVLIPNVESFPIREARSRITVHGLVIKAVVPDSIPSPHANTVTRQSPRAGSTVPAGTGVTLWYGTGLGDELVSVPSVVGMTIEEARAFLLDVKLRSVVIRDGNGTGKDRKVVDQGTAPGTSVRAGFEIRLYLEAQ